MKTHSNFLVKAVDTSMPKVKKALESAGIEVRSTLLVHKEEIEEPEDPQEEDERAEASLTPREVSGSD